MIYESMAYRVNMSKVGACKFPAAPDRLLNAGLAPHYSVPLLQLL